MILAFAGMPGAGKSSAIELLKKEGVHVVHLRLIIEEELKKNGLEINNKNLREMATKIREKHGRDAVVKKAIPEIEKAYKNGDVVIDSLKSPEEVQLLRKKFDTKIIAIHANPDIRFERLCSRSLAWDPSKREEFDWRDKKELSWGLGEVLALADIMIVNEKGMEKLRDRVKAMVKDIKKKV